AIKQLAIINEGDGFFYPRQGIDVELQIFDPPQSVPFLDDVTLFTVNGHVKSHTADQIVIDRLSGLAHRVSFTEKGLEIGADLDRRHLPSTQQSNEKTNSDNGAAVAAGQHSKRTQRSTDAWRKSFFSPSRQRHQREQGWHQDEREQKRDRNAHRRIEAQF